MEKNGFTMIVVAIIAFLATLAIPNYLRFVARSKRAEAHVQLAALYAAQKAHWVEHGTYTDVLSSAGLGWKPEGKTQYTYGFAGAPGVNYIAGSLPADLSVLGQAHADRSGFVAIAVADIDGDGKSDVITINDKNEITVASDDLS